MPNERATPRTTDGRACPAAAPPAAEAPLTHTGRDGRGILITEPAMRQLAALMTQQGPDKVLRVGVRSGGCSGSATVLSGAPISSEIAC